MRQSFIPLMLIMFVVVAGCSKPQVEFDNIPKWFTQTPEDSDYYFATATIKSPDIQMAIDTAKDTARAELASQLGIRITSMFKRFREQVGLEADVEFESLSTNVAKSFVSKTITGTLPVKTDIVKEGNDVRAYALVKMSIGAINSALVDTIKNQKQMYLRFRASEGFKELEEEKKEYQDFLKEQGGTE